MTDSDKPTRRSRTVEAQLAAFHRRNKAIRLRASGASFAQIADHLGYKSKASAYEAVMSALREHWNETAPDRNTLIMRSLMTLDTLQMAAWKAAMSGDLEAIRVIVRIEERRARMLGTDAPTKIEITDELDREIAALTANMAEEGTWDVDEIAGEPDPMPSLTDGGIPGGDPD